MMGLALASAARDLLVREWREAPGDLDQVKRSSFLSRPDPPEHRRPDAGGDHDPQAGLGLNHRPAQSTGGVLDAVLTGCL